MTFTEIRWAQNCVLALMRSGDLTAARELNNEVRQMMEIYEDEKKDRLARERVASPYQKEDAARSPSG